MSPKSRYLEPYILADLKKKMVFLGGPRQVGKTTLSRAILPKDGVYLNWDYAPHRERLLRGEIPVAPMVVLDEVHKYRNWRQLLKGHYDVFKGETSILVTGSARLDYYRFGGDSLQGRYHFLRLNPLSVKEVGIETARDFETLMKLGGFPEPFFVGTERDAKRWSQEYRMRLIRDDLQSLETVQDLGALEHLMIRLPNLVGSPLSYNAVKDDLQKSQPTVRKWVDILERLYAVFRISPFGPPRIRAVRKEQKHYQYDWTLVENEGARFENVVACHLLKWVQFENDINGREVELRYFRDVYKREVDFVLVEKKKPLLFVECKLSDTSIDPSLVMLKEKFSGVRTVQVVARTDRHYVKEGIEVIPAIRFLSEFI